MIAGGQARRPLARTAAFAASSDPARRLPAIRWAVHRDAIGVRVYHAPARVPELAGVRIMKRLALAVLLVVAAFAATARPGLARRSWDARGEPGAGANGERATLGGRQVDIWRPSGTGAAPIIVFSHGFAGRGRQSTFLTSALAEAG